MCRNVSPRIRYMYEYMGVYVDMINRPCVTLVGLFLCILGSGCGLSIGSCFSGSCLFSLEMHVA